MLRAASAVVGFTGRAALLEELRAWRDGVAVELIHGPGGQGKTRLAELWQGEGWVVLSAHHRRDRSPDSKVRD